MQRHGDCVEGTHILRLNLDSKVFCVRVYDVSLFADTPDRWTASSSELGQLYGVFRCNIGDLSVVYGAPMGVYQGKLKK